jgi:hypothetical protein
LLNYLGGHLGEEYRDHLQEIGSQQYRYPSRAGNHPGIPQRDHHSHPGRHAGVGLGRLLPQRTPASTQRFVKTFANLPFRLFTQAYKLIHNRLEFTFTLEKLNKELMRQQ